MPDAPRPSPRVQPPPKLGADRVRDALAQLAQVTARASKSIPPGSPGRAWAQHAPAILMALAALITAIATARPAPPPSPAVAELRALRACLRERAQAERSYRRLVGSALGDVVGVKASGLNPDPVVWASLPVPNGDPPRWGTNYELPPISDACLGEPSVPDRP